MTRRENEHPEVYSQCDVTCTGGGFVGATPECGQPGTYHAVRAQLRSFACICGEGAEHYLEQACR